MALIQLEGFEVIYQLVDSLVDCQRQRSDRLLAEGVQRDGIH
jgi:hypothetical protein